MTRQLQCKIVPSSFGLYYEVQDGKYVVGCLRPEICRGWIGELYGRRENKAVQIGIWTEREVALKAMHEAFDEWAAAGRFDGEWTHL